MGISNIPNERGPMKVGFDSLQILKGDDGFSPIVSVDPITDGHRITIVTKNDTIRFDLRNGMKGEKGERGEQGPVGPAGEKGDKGDPLFWDMLTPEEKESLRGEKGEKGEKGDQGPIGLTGEPFGFEIIYTSVQEMNDAYATDGVKVGRYVLVSTDDPEDPDNATVYVKTNSRYKFVVDMSGARGAQGPVGPQGVQGPMGNDYQLTQRDIQEIANIVLQDFPRAEEVVL